MLHKKKEAYEVDKTSVSSCELKKLLPQMKKTEALEWLKEIDSMALQNAVLNMDKAYQNFFRNIKNGVKAGFLKFKSRHSSRQSYQTQNTIKKRE